MKESVAGFCIKNVVREDGRVTRPISSPGEDAGAVEYRFDDRKPSPWGGSRKPLADAQSTCKR